RPARRGGPHRSTAAVQGLRRLISDRAGSQPPLLRAGSGAAPHGARGPERSRLPEPAHGRRDLLEDVDRAPQGQGGPDAGDGREDACGGGPLEGRGLRALAPGEAEMRALVAPVLLAMAAFGQAAEPTKADAVRLMTLYPGHFHAALIQKEMYPGVSDTVHVYAPLGPDLSAHLLRIAQFNLRPDNPTRWREEIHATPDFLERMLRERPGNVVVLSGRNLGKIDCILASVEAGLHVLADKPWIIDAADFPKLEKALDTAEARGVVAYDVMTERSEITTVLQRELVADPAVLGGVVAGTEAQPGLEMESVHHIMKMV